MKGFILLVVLSVQSLLAHAALERVLSRFDLVDALLVRGSLPVAALAATLLLERLFLIVIAPAWCLSILAARWATGRSRR